MTDNKTEIPLTALQHWIEDDPDGPDGVLGAWATALDFLEDEAGQDLQELMRLQKTRDNGDELLELEPYAYQVGIRAAQRLRTMAEALDAQTNRLAKENVQAFWLSIGKKGFWATTPSSRMKYLVTDVSSLEAVKFRAFLDGAEVDSELEPFWKMSNMVFTEAERR